MVAHEPSPLMKPSFSLLGVVASGRLAPVDHGPKGRVLVDDLDSFQVSKR